MIEELARVVALDGGFAELEVVRGSSCGSCSAKASCGTSVLSRFLGSRTARIRLENSLQAQIGEEIILGLPEQALPKASFLVYILPLLTMLGGALGVDGLLQSYGVSGGSELFTIAAGASGLWGGILLSRRFVAEASPGDLNAQFQPVMLRRVHSSVPGISIPIR